MGFAQITDEYPWDSLGEYIDRAKAHSEGFIDLSIGTPIDPTPQVVRSALTAASDSHGYPTTAGSTQLRNAVAAWFERRRGVPGLLPEQIIATVGSKELVGLLPSLLGLGAQDVVVHPQIAYPTYDVGARLAGASALASDQVEDWAEVPGVKLVWVNSPANPHGRVADATQLRAVVQAARARGAVVVSDECYALLNWQDDPVPSLLDPRISGGDHTGLLVAYSLSKQSNMAGYRAGILAGDQDLVTHILRLRKHLGLMVPAPVQSAMASAFNDDAHAIAQRELYAKRRQVLLQAFLAQGWQLDHSEAGLYLWLRKTGHDCWSLLSQLADLGILAGPGAFYGPAGRAHVRVSLTASDADISRAAQRLTSS